MTRPKADLTALALPEGGTAPSPRTHGGSACYSRHGRTGPIIAARLRPQGVRFTP